LEAFEESLPEGARFLDEVDGDVRLGFRYYLAPTQEMICGEE
jgi:hypothetical protein